MHDAKSKTARSMRTYRRSILCALIFAASPAFAEQPGVPSLRGLPPLPIEAQTNPTIRVNPFCVVPRERSGVQLASDNQPTQLRLKPIGTAVGLHPIDAPRNSASPVLVVESPAAPIRSNSYVDSQHHGNPELIDAPVDTIGAGQAAKQRSSMVLMPSDQPMESQPAPVPQVATPTPAVSSPALSSQSVPAARVRTNETAPTVELNPHAMPLETGVPVQPVEGSAAAADASLPAGLAAKPIPAESGPSSPSDLKPVPQAAEAPLEAPSTLDRVAEAPAEEPPQATGFSSHLDDSEPITFSMSDFTPDESAEATPAAVQPEEKLDLAMGKDPLPQTSDAANPAESSDTPANAEAAVDPSATVVRGGQVRLRAVEPLQIATDEQTSADSASELPPTGDIEPVVIADPYASVADSPKATLSSIDDDAAPEFVAPPKLASGDPAATRIHAATPNKPELIYRDEAEAKPEVAASQPEMLRRNRYRPPVDVAPPPLTVMRPSEDSKTAIVRPPVKAVDAPKLQPTESQMASGATQTARAEAASPRPLVDSESTKLTPLYMTRAQVRSLTLGGNVRRVEIGDKSVCQAFAAGPSQLKLIGTRNGITQLVVWADTTDSALRMRAFEIHVEDSVAATGEAVVDRTEMLNRSIRNMFPDSKIVVRRGTDQLIVAGECDSEETATKVIRMIRKTCLVPVRDQLRVR